MTATARIVFSAFSSSADPMFAAWNRFRDAVESASCKPASVAIGRPPARVAIRRPQTPGPCALWRILAPNNRELARSARAYLGFDGARDHVLRIRERVEELDIVLVTGDGAGRHGWYFLLDGAVVLTCSRWYGGGAVAIEAAVATIDALRSGVVDVAAHELATRRRAAQVTAPVAAPW